MDECARMNCDKEAVALLTFAPQEAKAWLYDLVESDSTGGIMLCRGHANATVVPMSWQLVDVRDPAWPGRAMAEAAAASPATAPAGSGPDAVGPDPVDVDAVEASVRKQLVAALPSDASLDREFAALDGALPVTPQPYREPREATVRASGVDADCDADMSLFELPLADVPAVTPHPDFR